MITLRIIRKRNQYHWFKYSFHFIPSVLMVIAITFLIIGIILNIQFNHQFNYWYTNDIDFGELINDQYLVKNIVNFFDLQLTNINNNVMSLYFVLISFVFLLVLLIFLFGWKIYINVLDYKNKIKNKWLVIFEIISQLLILIILFTFLIYFFINNLSYVNKQINELNNLFRSINQCKENTLSYGLVIDKNELYTNSQIMIKWSMAMNDYHSYLSLTKTNLIFYLFLAILGINLFYFIIDIILVHLHIKKYKK